MGEREGVLYGIFGIRSVPKKAVGQLHELPPVCFGLIAFFVSRSRVSQNVPRSFL